MEGSKIVQSPNGAKTVIGDVRFEAAVRSLLGIILLGSGCLHYADLGTGIALELQVLDEMGRPLEGAEILFVDTGIAPSAQTTVETRTVGQTDEQGRLKTFFVYRWGYSWRVKQPSFPNPKAPGTFEIVAIKDGFQKRSQEFSIAILPRPRGQSNEYEVAYTFELETVN